MTLDDHGGEEADHREADDAEEVAERNRHGVEPLAGHEIDGAGDGLPAEQRERGAHGHVLRHQQQRHHGDDDDQGQRGGQFQHRRLHEKDDLPEIERAVDHQHRGGDEDRNEVLGRHPEALAEQSVDGDPLEAQDEGRAERGDGGVGAECLLQHLVGACVVPLGGGALGDGDVGARDRLR